jgi:hypothetical protein
MKNSILSLAVLSTLVSTAVMAGSPISVPATALTTGAASKTDTKAYVGLNWSLGGGATPALVLGVLNTKVKSDGDTTGANLAFHLNLAGGVKPGKLKLSYLDGKENLQGELGVGYDFIKAAPLLSLGLNAPYIAAGVDGYLNPGFVPYATLHSQGKFDKPAAPTTTYSCPINYTLFETTCTQIVN